MSNLKEKVKDIPVLTKEQEIDLFARLGNGDNSVVDELIKHNLRLVASLAIKFCTSRISLDTDDLISEGVIGLKTAILKYEYKRNLKFSTYATYWIKQSMLRAIYNKSKIVRIPCYMEERLATKRKASKYGIEVSDDNEPLEVISFVDVDYTADYRGLAHGDLASNLEAWNGKLDSNITRAEAKLDRSSLCAAISGIKVISPKERRTFYYSVAGESVKNIARRLRTSPDKVRGIVRKVTNVVRGTISCQDYL